MKKIMKYATPVMLAVILVVTSILAFSPQVTLADQQAEPAEWTTMIDDLLDGYDYVEGEVIAVFDNSQSGYGDSIFSTLSDGTEAEEIAEVSGEAVVETFNDNIETASDNGAGIQFITNYSKTTKEILEELADNPAVIWAEPNYILYTEDIYDETLDEVTEAEATDEIETVEGIQDNGNFVEESADEETIANEEETETDLITEAVVTPQSTDTKKLIYTSNSCDLIETYGYKTVGDQSYLQWAYTTEDTGLYSISAPEWNVTNGKNVKGTPVVAIIDSGIDYTHPEFDGIIIDMTEYSDKGGKFGYNCSGEGKEDDPMDDNGHGTHCAGIVAAAWDGIGSSGVASGVKLSIVKTSAGGSFTEDNIVRAFLYLSEAVDNGLNLYSINCSFGGQIISNIETLMANELGKKGVITCVASGNSSMDNDDHVNSAADFSVSPYAVVVDASAANYISADYTNYGQSTTNVFSPGDAILSPVSSQAAVYNAAFDTHRVYYDGFSSDITSDKQVKISYAGEIDTTEKEYISFETFSELETFINDATTVGTRITGSDSFDKDDWVYEVDVPGTTKSGHRQVFLAAVPVDENNMSSIAYYSFALKSTLNNVQTWVRPIEFQTVDAGSEMTSLTVGGNTGWKRPSKVWVSQSCAVSKNVESSRDRGIPCYNGYVYFAIIVYDARTTGEESKLYIDSAGAGNASLRYDYFQGTSMATPAITGATAVMYDKLVYDGSLEGLTASEKAIYVANTMKASVIPNDNYKSICTSNGAFSFDVEEDDYTPVINTVSQDGNVLTLKGQYFKSTKGTLTVAGVECTVNSWSDSLIEAVLPDSVEGGRNLLCLTASNGKMTSRKVVTTAATGKASFEVSVELPDEIKGCKVSTMTGIDGILYLVPETATMRYDKVAENKQIWSYNPATDEWKHVTDIPVGTEFDKSPNRDEAGLSTYNGLLVVTADYTSKAAAPASTVEDSPENAEERETLIFFYNPKTDTWTKADTDGLGLPQGGGIFSTDYGVFYYGGFYIDNDRDDYTGVEYTVQTETNKIFKLNFDISLLKSSGNTIKIDSITEVGTTGKHYGYFQQVSSKSVCENDVLLASQNLEKLTWSESENKFTTSGCFNLPENMTVVGKKGEPVTFLANFTGVLTLDGLLITALNGDNYTNRGYDTFYLGDNDNVTPFGKNAYFADLYEPVSCVSNGYLYVWGDTFFSNDVVCGYLTYTKVRTSEPEPEPETTTIAPTTTQAETTTVAPTTQPGTTTIAPSTQQETTTAKKSVDTGDRSNATFYVIMIIFAAALATTAIGVKVHNGKR